MKHQRVKLGLTILVLLVFICGIIVVIRLTEPPSLEDGRTVGLAVDKQSLRATVAATDTSRAQGLASQNALADNRGMLFVFPKADLWPFWMKGVTFPIDIIWINNDNVTEVTPSVPPADPSLPDSQLPNYRPTGPVDRVLEVAAGWAARFSIQPGDPVKFTR